jgi:hypothetical protein
VVLAEERERARRVATGIVSAAIGIVGLTLVILAIILVVRGGLGFVFLAILLLAIGGALALLGFFFQLVPFRLQELADEKRDYDQRQRQGLERR